MKPPPGAEIVASDSSSETLSKYTPDLDEHALPVTPKRKHSWLTPKKMRSESGLGRNPDVVGFDVLIRPTPAAGSKSLRQRTSGSNNCTPGVRSSPQHFVPSMICWDG